MNAQLVTTALLEHRTTQPHHVQRVHSPTVEIYTITCTVILVPKVSIVQQARPLVSVSLIVLKTAIVRQEPQLLLFHRVQLDPILLTRNQCLLRTVLPVLLDLTVSQDRVQQLAMQVITAQKELKLPPNSLALQDTIVN